MSRSTPSLSAYAAGLVLLVLLVIGGFTWLVVERAMALDRDARLHNASLAADEMRHTLADVKERVRQLTETLAQWDETRQQLRNPTYYEYWRERRVAETRLAPDFFDGIELYDRHGQPLGGKVTGQMPKSVSGKEEAWRTVVDDTEGHAHLYHVYPLKRAKTAELHGYVVLELDLTGAIADTQRFRYVDHGSIRVAGQAGEVIPEAELLSRLDYDLQPNWGFDRLEELLLGALWQFALAAAGLLIITLYLLVSLGSMPLVRLTQYIDRLGRGEPEPMTRTSRLLPLAEFEKVRSSLNDYHVRLMEGARALQNSEERMRAVLHNVVDAIITFNAEGEIESANPAVARIFGWRPEELVGHQVARLFANLEPGELQRLAVHLDTDRDAVSCQRSERVGQSRDGLQFPVELTLSRLTLPDRENFIAVIEDITDRKAAEQRLLYLANFDSLTGLPNRTLLRDRLEHAMLQADRLERLVGVLFLDLDRFKTVNDTLGHHSGDQLLCVVAERLKHCIRSGDTVARLGGDEFMVVVEGMKHVDEASHVARQLQEAFEEPIQLHNRELFITPSIGVTLYPLDDSDSDALLRNADSAMYRAKELGGDRIQFFTQDLNNRAEERLSMESCLRQALGREEFRVAYQPRLDASTGVTVAAEALLRWQHPELGEVSPERFIPILEEIGLIEPVGLWVLRTACAQAMAWSDSDRVSLRMAVNVSARQFHTQGFVDDVRQVLAETGLPPGQLELEITESALLENIETNRQTLVALRDMGVHIALDDFGTGYSALSYLRQFPIDTMKIDRSFLANVPQSEDDARLVSALVAIASSLDLRVTAEGVETEAQLVFLAGLGCQEVQGFFYAKALSVPAFEQWLDQRTLLSDASAT